MLIGVAAPVALYNGFGGSEEYRELCAAPVHMGLFWYAANSRNAMIGSLHWLLGPTATYHKRAVH
jgi:hypothetical protein